MIRGNGKLREGFAGRERIPADHLQAVRQGDGGEVAAVEEGIIAELGHRTGQRHAGQAVIAAESFGTDRGNGRAAEIRRNDDIPARPGVAGDDGGAVRLQGIQEIPEGRDPDLLRGGARKKAREKNHQRQQYGPEPSHACVTPLFQFINHIFFSVTRQWFPDLPE